MSRADELAAGAEFPDGDEEADEFGGEGFEGLAVLPPLFGVEVAVAGADYGELDVRREDMAKDVAGAARIEVGGDDEEMAPIFLGGEGGERLGFVARSLAIVGRGEDFFFGDAPFEEVVLQ